MLKIFKNKRHTRIEQTKHQVKQKWSGIDGTKRSYPTDCKNIETDLADIMLSYCSGLVCEIGCGDGRIAQHISDKQYIGLDINSHPIEQSK